MTIVRKHIFIHSNLLRVACPLFILSFILLAIFSSVDAQTESPAQIKLRQAREEAKKEANARRDAEVKRREAEAEVIQLKADLTQVKSSAALEVALSATDVRIKSEALFEMIYRGSDANQIVKLQPIKSLYKIGVDFIEFEITSNRSGYLTLFSVGSSGKIYKLFPNKFDSSNYITVGMNLKLPRDTWRLRSHGPAGLSKFMAVISNTSDRFAGMGLPEGPYSKLENTLETAKAIVSRVMPDGNSCVPPSTRDFFSESNLCVPKCVNSGRDFLPEGNPCQSDYGASISVVTEIN